MSESKDGSHSFNDSENSAGSEEDSHDSRSDRSFPAEGEEPPVDGFEDTSGEFDVDAKPIPQDEMLNDQDEEDAEEDSRSSYSGSQGDESDKDDDSYSSADESSSRVREDTSQKEETLQSVDHNASILKDANADEESFPAGSGKVSFTIKEPNPEKKTLIILCTMFPNSEEEVQDQDRAMKFCKVNGITPHILMGQQKPPQRDELLRISNRQDFPQFFLYWKQVVEYIGDFGTIQQMKEYDEFGPEMLDPVSSDSTNRGGR